MYACFLKASECSVLRKTNKYFTPYMVDGLGSPQTPLGNWMHAFPTRQMVNICHLHSLVFHHDVQPVFDKEFWGGFNYYT